MGEAQTLGDIMRAAVTPVFAPPRELPPSVGERNSAARLTTDKVRALRTAADAGIPVGRLAYAWGISDRAARHIIRRTTWQHVD